VLPGRRILLIGTLQHQTCFGVFSIPRQRKTSTEILQSWNQTHFGLGHFIVRNIALVHRRGSSPTEETLVFAALKEDNGIGDGMSIFDTTFSSNRTIICNLLYQGVAARKMYTLYRAVYYGNAENCRIRVATNTNNHDSRFYDLRLIFEGDNTQPSVKEVVFSDDYYRLCIVFDGYTGIQINLLDRDTVILIRDLV